MGSLLQSLLLQNCCWMPRRLVRKMNARSSHKIQSGNKMQKPIFWALIVPCINTVMLCWGRAVLRITPLSTHIELLPMNKSRQDYWQPGTSKGIQQTWWFMYGGSRSVCGKGSRAAECLIAGSKWRAWVCMSGSIWAACWHDTCSKEVQLFLLMFPNILYAENDSAM